MRVNEGKQTTRLLLFFAVAKGLHILPQTAVVDFVFFFDQNTIVVIFSGLLGLQKHNMESAKVFLSGVRENPTLLEDLKATQ